MFRYTAMFIISNAIAVRQDKSFILHQLTPYVIVSLHKCLNCIFTPEFIIIFISLGFIVYVYKKWGHYHVFAILAYIYHLYKFLVYVEYSYMYYVTLSTLITLSVFTLILLFVNKPKINNYCYFELICSISKEYFILLVCALVIIREVRLLTLGLINITDINISAYIFISFSLFIPFTFLSRITYNILYDIWIYGDNSLNILVLLTVKQLINRENYILQNISVSNLILIVYITSPLLIICVDMLGFFLDEYEYKYTATSTLENNKKTNLDLYTIYSIDDISFPAWSFTTQIHPNMEQSLTLNELMHDGARGIPKRIGQGTVWNCRLLYNNEYWVRSNGNVFFKESYLKSVFTRSIGNFISHDIQFNFMFNMGVRDYMSNSAVNQKMVQFENNIENESKADALIATLLPVFFGINKGYGYNPQHILYNSDNYSLGKIDFLVDNNNIPVLLSEHKAVSKSADSWLSLIGQAKSYAKSVESHTTAFVMILKGTRISFFIYDEDWHSDHNLDLKCEEFEDMIGLYVDTEGIKCVTQLNTYHPQMTIYNAGSNSPDSHRLAISSILSYISNFRSGAGINDNFRVPNHSNDNSLLGQSQLPNRPGLNFHLQLDAFGRFKHIQI